jgi:class 3 adenylate cyclase
MAAAKAVVDGAQGAMVLMSDATYKQLHMEDLGQQVLVLQCGSHTLKGAAAPMDVYQVGAVELPRVHCNISIRQLDGMGAGWWKSDDRLAMRDW